MKQPKILIIEEESIIALELKLMLQSLGFMDIDVLNSTKNLKEKILSFKPDLILSEIYFVSDIDIIKIIKSIRKNYFMDVIIITSLQYMANDPRLKSIAPLAIVGKPFQLDEISEALKKKYPIGQVPNS